MAEVWEDIGAHLHPDDLEQLRKVRHPGLWQLGRKTKHVRPLRVAKVAGKNAVMSFTQPRLSNG